MRARVVADVAAGPALSEAGYFERLGTLYQTAFDDRVDEVRQLLLDTVVRAPGVDTDAARDILTAWFALRAREGSRERPGRTWYDPESLRRIIGRVAAAT